jgi:hypothetical protein
MNIKINSFYTSENLAYGFQEIEVFEENAGKGKTFRPSYTIPDSHRSDIKFYSFKESLAVKIMIT